MLSKVDVGKRDVYTYHVLNSTQSTKVDMNVVEAWFPKTAHQEEIFILNKLLSLANWRDGQYISFTEHTLPLAFMTACSKSNYNKAGEFLGYMPNKEAVSLAVSRFNDFSARGLITGRANYFAVSFSGKLELEERVNISDSRCAEIVDSLQHLTDAIEMETEMRNVCTKVLSSEINELVELLKKKDKPSAKNLISVANDATSLCTFTAKAIPAALKVINGIIALF